MSDVIVGSFAESHFNLLIRHGVSFYKNDRFPVLQADPP